MAGSRCLALRAAPAGAGGTRRFVAGIAFARQSRRACCQVMNTSPNLYAMRACRIEHPQMLHLHIDHYAPRRLNQESPEADAADVCRKSGRNRLKATT